MSEANQNEVPASSVPRREEEKASPMDQEHSHRQRNIEDVEIQELLESLDSVPSQWSGGSAEFWNDCSAHSTVNGIDLPVYRQ